MNEWLLLIGAMTVLTFTPRYLPFGMAGKVKIPPIPGTRFDICADCCFDFNYNSVQSHS